MKDKLKEILLSYEFLYSGNQQYIATISGHQVPSTHHNEIKINFAATLDPELPRIEKEGIFTDILQCHNSYHHGEFVIIDMQTVVSLEDPTFYKIEAVGLIGLNLLPMDVLVQLVHNKSSMKVIEDIINL